MVPNNSGRTTVLSFENRIGASAVAALCVSLNGQLLGQGYLARSGQIVDSSLVLAPKQQATRLKAAPAAWVLAIRRRRETNATWKKKAWQELFLLQLSVSVARRYKLIQKIETDTAIVHDGRHFESVFARTNSSAVVYGDRG